MARIKMGLLAVLLGFTLLAGFATGTEQDGRPRPYGYPDTPTVDYGPTPSVLGSNGLSVTCDWYGFSHLLYPQQGAQCNAGMRKALSNTTLFGPGDLQPYTYYYSSYYVFDPTTNATYCLYGCFNLGASAPAPSLFAPPPLTLAPPPPVVAAPAPAQDSPPPIADSPPPVADSPPPVADSPPPVADSPPPVTLTPAPAVDAPPPLSDSPPPAADSPPPLADSPPPDADSPPPSTITTPNPPDSTLAPPPPARTINLSGAGFVRPAVGLSFALLLINGLFA